MQKEFDLVIYGATGFTGRLAAQYLMRPDKCTSLRIAIAGRDIKKLKAVQEVCAIKPAILIADSSNTESIDTMVKKTKVIVSFAGPFSLYGEPIIASCAKWGVNYLDITGETPFIHAMIKQYQDLAISTGARLIPFSGFDSIPADLLVYIAMKAAHKQQIKINNLSMYYQIKGGFNGGTLATALHMAEHADKKVLRNINCLTPSLPWHAAIPSTIKPTYEPILKRWSTPFFMELINKAVVYRSNYLRSQENDYAPIFEYEERILMSKTLGYLKGALTSLSLTAFFFLSKYSIGRALLKRIGPKPGEGPSDTTRQQGFFRGQLICRDQNTCKMIVSMERHGDPGNEITVTLACESSLLAVNNAYVTDNKGFITPSIAFGEKLISKLESAGFQFKHTRNHE